ncbi:Uncharacterised protein [uncultured archaeon]|nr:Uncharacterised protein [uncultured archaeon]
MGSAHCEPTVYLPTIATVTLSCTASILCTNSSQSLRSSSGKSLMAFIRYLARPSASICKGTW